MILRRIAEALGLDALPDHATDLLACMIATHRAGRKRLRVCVASRALCAAAMMAQKQCGKLLIPCSTLMLNRAHG
jgi:hypothetical protein